MSGRAARAGGATAERLDYDEAKRQAADPDADIRRALARRDDVQPEILYYLAEDAEPRIRREIAENPATPVQADLILSHDPDDDVRCRVAAKIAQLAPQLDEIEREKIGGIVIDILRRMAEDQLVRVRAILAETLKDTDEVPADIIETLARDPEIEVSGPVLANSPLLSEELLKEIIESGPVKGAVAAIARRRDLGEAVAEAVVTHDDTDAIGALLANRSAQIREETLDLLVDRGQRIPAWHALLVGRPRLSSRAVKRLAHYVAEHLIGDLKRRSDIDPGTLAEIGAIVGRRIETDGTADQDAADDDPDLRAERLHAAGKLDDAAILSAVETGDRELAISALALRAGLPSRAARKIAALHSAKGMVALAWKAGLEMRDAVPLQLGLARVPPGEALQPADGGGYPLSADDMDWQLEFFQD